MEPDAARTQINDLIKRIWFRLTEDEMRARTEQRDLFYLAVHRKHGIVRAQAQLVINELEKALGVAA